MCESPSYFQGGLPPRLARKPVWVVPTFMPTTIAAACPKLSVPDPSRIRVSAECRWLSGR